MSTLKELDPLTLSPPMDITWVREVSGLQKVRDFLCRVTTVGLDVETNVAPTFLERKIRTIQIGDRNEQYVIDLLKFAGSQDRLMEQGGMVAPDWALPIVEALRPALDSNSHLKIGVNLQFDYEALLWCLGLRMWNLYDCYLAEKALHAGEVGFFTEGYYSMQGMCARYAKVSVDKALQKSFDLCSPMTSEQLLYAALDTRLPFVIRQAQSIGIAKDKLEKCVEIENNAIPAFGDMRVYGFKLSEARWNAVTEKNQKAHADNISKLDTFFLSIVGSKHRQFEPLEPLELAWRSETDRERRAERRKAYQVAARGIREHAKNLETYAGEAAINYESNPQLLAALRKAGFGPKMLKSTSNDELKKHSAKHPIIKALIDYRNSSIRLKTFGDTFIEKYINPTTNRVHSNIDQYGAETGRTTSSAPNIQNIPRTKEYRHCFIAEIGWKLITNDYNGCELRILAEVSGEKVWIDAFNKGWDVHSVGAEILFGAEWASAAEDGCAYVAKHEKCNCKKHKELRDKVKAINFGIAYGMEAKKLARDLGISVTEAQELLDRYRNTFKQVTAWLVKAGNYGKMYLMCRTLSGRIRRFVKPTWERARAIAEQRAVADGKEFDNNDVTRAYYGLYSSIERESKNTPIQGTNADMVKLAVGCGFDSDGKPYLWHVLREFGAKLVNIVHDEIVVEAVEQVAEVLQGLIGDCMVRAGAEFVKAVPMTYEGKIADEWSK